MGNEQKWIDGLQLRRHPEGGYYRESYRSGESIVSAHLPARFTGDRLFSTAIYFLLAGQDFSALHRIKSDEVWHFYDGTALTIHVIDLDGNYCPFKLGKNLANAETPQGVVSAGCFFGATVDDPQSFALVGCTVAPGFDFSDFELPGRDDLCRRFPQHRNLIERLTR